MEADIFPTRKALRWLHPKRCGIHSSPHRQRRETSHGSFCGNRPQHCLVRTQIGHARIEPAGLQTHTARMVPAYLPVTLRLTRQAGSSEITAIAERLGEGEWRISASLILLAAHGVVQAVHEVELPHPLSARSDVEAASFAMEKATRLLERIEKHAS